MSNLIIHQSDLDIIAPQNQSQDDFERERRRGNLAMSNLAVERLHELAVLKNFEKLTSESEEVQLEI